MRPDIDSSKGLLAWGQPRLPLLPCLLGSLAAELSVVLKPHMLRCSQCSDLSTSPSGLRTSQPEVLGFREPQRRDLVMHPSMTISLSGVVRSHVPHPHPYLWNLSKSPEARLGYVERRTPAPQNSVLLFCMKLSFSTGNSRSTHSPRQGHMLTSTKRQAMPRCRICMSSSHSWALIATCYETCQNRNSPSTSPPNYLTIFP